MTDEEKRWIDRLNRIGIGYFRPLVAAVLSKSNEYASVERVRLFKAIERFIFVHFRLGNTNASFCSSEYYRAARNIYFGTGTIDQIEKEMNETVDLNAEVSVTEFATKIEKLFNSGYGYYGWNSIRYFMYEYEYSLAVKNGINKITWELFTKAEKDKVSIEHILPQTPTKFYWQNQFRQFSSEEIEQLAGALGNLLPLSQSVNSGLQNDSFEDKKHSKTSGRRGYENGSHSEIEVAKEADWDANRIYARSINLLNFMSERWNIRFTNEDKERLAYVSFVNDGRDVPEELSATVTTAANLNQAASSNPSNLEDAQLNFWTDFVSYCSANGRAEDIASRKPYGQNWYDIPVGASDYHISFTITRNKYLTLLIYAYNPDAFHRLESKKDAIEAHFGAKLDWYSSRKNSVAKRILYKREAEIYNLGKREEIFQWMVEVFDRLYDALDLVGE